MPVPNNIVILVVATVLVMILLYLLYGKYTSRRANQQDAAVPILLAYYTRGAMLVPAKQGLFGNMQFTAFVTVDFEELVTGGKAGLIFRVELPFQSSVHLMGIPKTGNEIQLDPSQIDTPMEHVELEGDYGKYFELYCGKGMQVDSRYVLDPKAMLFTLDFCQSQSWELVGNELYFVQTGANAANDPTLLSDDIVQFVREIKPAVAVPLSDTQKIQQAPYGKDRRTDLHCPICHKKLVNTGQCFVCPGGDGVLLTGSLLSKLTKTSSRLPKNTTSKKQRPHTLVCPSCHHSMQQVPYNGGSTIIDSCGSCAYRWLDAGELNTPVEMTTTPLATSDKN